MSPQADDLRIPKDHGSVHQTSEIVDLTGPVARITRTTYVNTEWTRIIVMVPPDLAHDISAQFLDITLNAKDLALLVERLAWPK